MSKYVLVYASAEPSKYDFLIFSNSWEHGIVLFFYIHYCLWQQEQFSAYSVPGSLIK